MKLDDIIGVDKESTLFDLDEDTIEVEEKEEEVYELERPVDQLPANTTVDEMTDLTIKKLINLTDMAVNDYVTLAPVFKAASEKLLKKFTSEDQLKYMEFPDALKLIDMATKYQLQPVKQLTDLISSLQGLHERTNIKNEIEKIKETAAQFSKLKEENTVDMVNGEIVDVTEEDTNSTDILNSLIK